MASKSPQKKHTKPTASQARAAGWKDPLQPQLPFVSGKWLLGAIGGAIAFAALCAYLTLCLLFYQGSWQLIFHPSHAITTTPAVPFQEIQFDYTETGKPQLRGWWVPAGPGAHYPDKTLLLLHDGRGSLSDVASRIDSFHTLGIHVFAFDYRGFGRSADLHPSEKTLQEDADAAVAYLTGTRHLPGNSIVLYGSGLGASVAATTATRHPEISAVILENIGPNAMTLFAEDARTRILPVRLLTSDRFNPAETLKALKTPKLFLSRSNTPETRLAFAAASGPKQLVEIAPGDPAPYLAALRRFLDEVLHP